MTTSIGTSIAALLGGTGSIDTGALVSQLVTASRAPREKVITSAQSLNGTRISALASATSSLDTFSNALNEVMKNANLAGQPVSNDPTIVALSTLPGGAPQGLPAQIEVQQLAAAQVLESVSLPTRTDAVGLGTLTLTTASGAKTITIDSSNNTLDGLAAAINGAAAGVTASVVVDSNGARLVMKGATGAANSFTLTKEATDTADTNLSRFTFDGTTGGMTKRQSALNSIVKIDGITHTNSSNTLDNALPYVRIDLNKAAPGTLVTLATNQPTSTIKDLLNEFVSAYNTLRSALNSATAAGGEGKSAGALAGDSGVRDMVNKLGKLTTTSLATTGAYRTLSDLGVKTNQDGTLALDSTRLDAAMLADPAGVAQMINPSVSNASTPGLAKIVSDLKTSVEASGGSLAGSKAKYDKLAAEYTKQMEKLDKDMDSYETQLSNVYSAMGTKLAALKATQTYLNNQIDAWNNTGKN
ncbi:MAG: flagellar filament capping protein FliD [Sphingobium sp.]|jgi:flagellar hook-associated protein 2|nr:flagellar filament capping protein FliD [Sphingobium sp.]MCI1270106.1 flagellar filament capping protein FliD [Sphingobium sp.]MCI1754967.1 flagellar filament capping protein FliD [Sphingobium sp.]MCI2051712.1 flagellar filament capping protein FliD [Sphingobium sp.]